jgi:hypothetical protein
MAGIRQDAASSAGEHLRQLRRLHLAAGARGPRGTTRKGTEARHLRSAPSRSHRRHRPPRRWLGESDLAALEAAGTKQPQSFVAYPAKSALNAWRKSIREAEALSALAGILTSRHFCLLAPRDGDPHHAAFVEEETQRRLLQEAASSIPRTDLDRFTAALGFCDLISLCLCSGLTDAIQMPLAHAADPAAQHASRVTVSLAEQTIRLNQPAMTSGTVVYVDGWILSAPKVLASHRFQWTIC